jgi:hypothetical protein
MFSWPAIRRLVIRTVFALFICSSSVWLVGKAIYAAEYFLARLGTPDLWRVLHAHPFTKSIGAGILAGLIPLQVWLTLSGFIRAEVPGFLRKLDLEGMKPWMVLIYSPFLGIAIFEWCMDWAALHARTITVLRDSSTRPVWQMFEGFFSTNCQDASDIRLDLWTDNFTLQCSVHILMISAFLTAVGYSLAPWIRSRVPQKDWTERPVSGETNQEEADSTNSPTSNEQAQ